MDLAVMSLAFWLAYLFRFEFAIPRPVLDGMLVYWPALIAWQYLGLVAFRVPRMSWRYLNMRDAVQLLVALAAPMVVVIVARFANVLPVASGGVIPFGVLAVDFVFVFLGVVGIRASRRMWGELQDRKKRATDGRSASRAADRRR